MSDNLKQFLKKISSDGEWRNKLSELDNKEAIVAQCIAKAKELGIELTAADFETPEGEMSEKELSAISGGGCGCVFAGAGGGQDRKEGGTYGCACVGYGQGGNGDADDFNCMCVMGGHGDMDESFFY